jgi:hypothetical protein
VRFFLKMRKGSNNLNKLIRPLCFKDSQILILPKGAEMKKFGEGLPQVLEFGFIVESSYVVFIPIVEEIHDFICPIHKMLQIPQSNFPYFFRINAMDK